VLLILAALLIVGSLGSLLVSAFVAAGFMMLLWLGVARAANLPPAARRRGGVLVGLDAYRASASLLVAATVAGIGVVIARALLTERTVTLSTVAGVLCLYLLLGLMFAQLYQAALELTDNAFIYSEALTRFDLVYFSFVTLTTVGFGDIVPGVDATRALAATEAVTGQLFLVTVVARVISMLGQERAARSRDTGSP
jgi:hypothetical protein